mgnify:CR=1 FL=1
MQRIRKTLFNPLKVDCCRCAAAYLYFLAFFHWRLQKRPLSGLVIEGFFIAFLSTLKNSGSPAVHIQYLCCFPAAARSNGQATWVQAPGMPVRSCAG